MMKDPLRFNTALVPGKEPDCPRWGEGHGGCIHHINVDKYGRM